MRRTRFLVSAMLLILLASSTSGCLGLVATRELMEWSRGTPTTSEQTESYSFQHTFSSNSTELEAIIHRPAPQDILFDEQVKEISIYFRVQMDLDEIGEFGLNNLTGSIRYVHARLWEPGANINTDEPFWEENATSDHYPPIERRYAPFKPGVWVLEVEAQGYGLTAPIEQFSFHDEFEVIVNVVRPCILYPEQPRGTECVPV